MYIMLFLLSRLFVYGYVVYQTYFTNLWTAIGLAVCFTMLELGFFLLGYLKQIIDALAITQAQATNTNFGFLTQPLVNEEADLVDRIRAGDATASAVFLSSRCKNTKINFEFLPAPVTVMLAQRLINAINRGESPSWSELLSGNKNEKEISV